MSTVDSQIKTVNEKLQQLLKQYLLIQKENIKLNDELKHLHQHKVQLDEQVDQLQLQVGLLKAASSTMDAQDKKDLERKINQYLKDIDKCINLLSE